MTSQRTRSTAAWMFAVFTVFAGAGRAEAQPTTASCASEFARCSMGCRNAGALIPMLARACQSGCTSSAESCRAQAAQTAQAAQAAQAARPVATPGASSTLPQSTPAAVAGDPAVAPPPRSVDPLTTPMTQDQINASVAAVGEPRGYAPPLAFRPIPPACQKLYGKTVNPAQCEIEQAKPLPRHSQDVLADTLAQLAPVGQSFDLDAAALPVEPLERFRALDGLRHKYVSFWNYLAGSRQQIARTRTETLAVPMLRFADAQEGKRRQLEARAQADPAVRRAYAQGQIPVSMLNLSPDGLREWNSDKATVSIREAALAAVNGSLFIDRAVDLEQSTRERGEATRFAAWGEPSANEIGLALLRALATDGGELRTPSESARIGPTHMLLEMANASIVYVTRLVHVDKRACSRVGKAYVCTVRLWALNYMNGAALEMLKSSPITFEHRAETALRAAGVDPKALNGQEVQITLAATPAGWAAPELAAAIVAEEDKIRAGMTRQAEKVTSHQECVRRNTDLFGRRFGFCPP